MTPSRAVVFAASSLALSLGVAGGVGCDSKSAGTDSAKAVAVPAEPKAPEVKAAKPAPASTTAVVGQPAPAFTLSDLDGKSVSLESLRGSPVVLEWFNPECPFVNKAHGPKGTLKDMAKRVSAKGVKWVAINSNAVGKQGHGVEANRAGKAKFGLEHPVLLDADGRVGKLYGATNTPHLFVIDGAGVLVYRGAIDSTQGGDPEPTETITNYVQSALDDVAAKRPVATPETKAFGCSVKY